MKYALNEGNNRITELIPYNKWHYCGKNQLIKIVFGIESPLIIKFSFYTMTIRTF